MMSIIYTEAYIYNCDETRLYYQLLPEKTLAAKAEKETPGMKKQKEHIIIIPHGLLQCYWYPQAPLNVCGKSSKSMLLEEC